MQASNTFSSFTGKNPSFEVMHSEVPIKCIPHIKYKVLSNANNFSLKLWGSRQLLLCGKEII